MADRSRRLETVGAGDAKIVTCIDGEGPTLVMLPSYGRDGLDDFDGVTDRIVAAGWRVLRPQPRGTAGSVGPMQGIVLKDLARDAARHRAARRGAAVVLGHAFGNFVARVVTRPSTNVALRVHVLFPTPRFLRLVDAEASRCCGAAALATLESRVVAVARAR